jgi:Glycosyl transferase family 11
MIVTQLLGGLGNQLFQYCLGRALAVKHQTELRLDLSAFDAYRLRTYALEHFRIKASVLTAAERSALGDFDQGKTRLGRRFSRLFTNSLSVVRERSFAFDPEVLNASPSCYLQGFWQSPKYFAAIETLIREELTVKDALAGPNREIAQTIADTVAVAVHVRRGDYATNPETNRYHGTCSPAYYEMAETFLRQHCSDMHLYVFSDDPEWTDKNLRFKSTVTTVRHNSPARDYEDLRLMSLCRHHIIANSTFGWWGAWLSRYQQRIVVAPKHWFGDLTRRTDDLIPESWIRL